MNAFGWCNIGIEALLRDYFPRTGAHNRIVSLGGFSAEEFEPLVDTVNERAQPGEIAAVEFNVSCHNVNFAFDDDPRGRARRGRAAERHPVILKLSPDYDYVAHARLAEEHGVAALTAINTVKGLRLDPRDRRAVHDEPLRRDVRPRRSSRSACGSSPSCARRASGSRSSPRAASATSTTAASTSGPVPTPSASAARCGSADAAYALGPLEGLRIRRLIDRVEGYELPAAIAEQWARRGLSQSGARGARASEIGADAAAELLRDAIPTV